MDSIRLSTKGTEQVFNSFEGMSKHAKNLFRLGSEEDKTDLEKIGFKVNVQEGYGHFTMTK